MGTTTEPREEDFEVGPGRSEQWTEVVVDKNIIFIIKCMKEGDFLNKLNDYYTGSAFFDGAWCVLLMIRRILSREIEACVGICSNRQFLIFEHRECHFADS